MPSLPLSCVCPKISEYYIHSIWVAPSGVKKWVGDGRTICCNLTCKVITAYARKGHHFHPFIVISFLPSLREGEVGHAGREEGRKEIGSKHVNVVPSSGICCNYFACQIAANGPSIIDPLFDL